MVLVGYWPLNESSGASEAKDHSGNENHGTINDGGDSTVSGATGVLGQNAFSFDGSNDYVAIEDDSELSLKDQITVSVWANLTESPVDNERLIQKDPENSVWLIWVKSSGEYWRWRVSAGGTTYTVDGPGVSLGKWTHVAGTWSSETSKMKFYVDGSKVGETNTGSSLDTSSQGIKIGSDGGSDNFWRGKISEARIYDRCLDPKEIQYLYQVGKRGRQVTSSKPS